MSTKKESNEAIKNEILIEMGFKSNKQKNSNYEYKRAIVEKK